MNSYRYTLLMALLMVGSRNGFSQQDARAEPYLQAVSGQFRLDEGYMIQMDYIREDVMRETRAEGEGTIWMKGLKYKIVVDEYIVYFDGTTLYSQNTDAQEVYVSIPDPDEPGYLQAVPIRILKSYERDFKYQFMGRSSFMGRDLVEVQLYPMDLTGPYSMLKLFIHPVTMKLEVIQLRHKEGIHYTMVLSRIAGNQSLEDAMFAFDPSAYPDTEVIELIE